VGKTTARIFQLPWAPYRFAVSASGSYIVGGVFFLDFIRPLKVMRFLGFAYGLRVPVVHEGELQGGNVIYVPRRNPCFAQLLALWKEHSLSKPSPPNVVADASKIRSDFTKQFPDEP
jgi:hypothetical protein